MDWTAYVDNYCERLEPGLGAEPLNALTNLAFVAAAFWVWPRVRGDRGAQVLCAVLLGIGIASGLFHTLANRWSGAADSLSILLFILVYIYLAGQRVLGLSVGLSALLVPLFVPYSFAVAAAISAVVGSLNGSVAYLPVLLLIVIFALLARNRAAARGLLAGAGILAVSLTARSVDQAICPVLHIGSHFLWHLLNAAMLGWMILVIHRAGLAGPRAGG